MTPSLKIVLALGGVSGVAALASIASWHWLSYYQDQKMYEYVVTKADNKAASNTTYPELWVGDKKNYSCVATTAATTTKDDDCLIFNLTIPAEPSGTDKTTKDPQLDWTKDIDAKNKQTLTQTQAQLVNNKYYLLRIKRSLYKELSDDSRMTSIVVKDHIDKNGHYDQKYIDLKEQSKLSGISWAPNSEIAYYKVTTKSPKTGSMPGSFLCSKTSTLDVDKDSFGARVGALNASSNKAFECYINQFDLADVNNKRSYPAANAFVTATFLDKTGVNKSWRKNLLYVFDSGNTNVLTLEYVNTLVGDETAIYDPESSVDKQP